MNINKHPLDLFKFCPKCGSNNFIINDFKSKHCEDCKFTYYFNPSSSTVAIIINRQQEILVATRAYEPEKGKLDLPGGFVDKGETAEHAIKREVKEETNIEISSCRYLFSIPNTYLYSGFEVETTDLFFLCEIPDNIKIIPKDDVALLQFIPITEVQPELFGLKSIREGVRKIKNLEISLTIL